MLLLQIHNGLNLLSPLKAKVCQGCANKSVTANTFNYRTATDGGRCLFRYCENGLHIVPYNPGLSIYIKAGYSGKNYYP